MSNSLNIIPKPQKAIRKDGIFVLSAGHRISYPEAGRQAAQLIQKLTGAVTVLNDGEIRLISDPSIAGKEAYQLLVSGNGVELRASTAAGFFYAAQSLRQLMPAELENGISAAIVQIPYLHIEDSPRFEHRGFMLDVSRHFFGVDEIKNILGLMALQKLNRFHWHLTDDQGWRIEIKKYPRLAEIGSIRKCSQVGGWILQKPIYDNKPYSGYYTQDEIREIVAYARSLFIEVIPEIGMPGHASAAMAAYPQLTCDGQPVEVRPSVTTFSKPVCVGKEFVFEFMADVYREIAELFPFGYIHIGGDEVNTKSWKNCPDCQKRMKDEGLKNGRDLQLYFENRLVKKLHSQGTNVIGWSEVVNDDLDENVINQYWIYTTRKNTINAIKKGRKTIISDFSKMYLDYSFNAIELIRSYLFEPCFSELSDAEEENIIGVEGPLWTEYVDSRERLYWQMFPRLTAISETAWCPKGVRDFPGYIERLAEFEERLAVLNIPHASKECYLKYRTISKVPQIFKILFTKDHPGNIEYKHFHG